MEETLTPWVLRSLVSIALCSGVARRYRLPSLKWLENYPFVCLARKVFQPCLYSYDTLVCVFLRQCIHSPKGTSLHVCCLLCNKMTTSRYPLAHPAHSDQLPFDFLAFAFFLREGGRRGKLLGERAMDHVRMNGFLYDQEKTRESKGNGKRETRGFRMGRKGNPGHCLNLFCSERFPFFLYFFFPLLRRRRFAQAAKQASALRLNAFSFRLQRSRTRDQ